MVGVEGGDTVAVMGVAVMGVARGLHRRVAVVCVVALVLSACAGAAPAEPVATDRCEAPALQELQAGLHLIGDRQPPVPYSSVPPTSGWHRSGVAEPGVAAAPLAEPLQVGLLEEGRVVISHGRVDGQAAAALTDVADAHPEMVAVTPYEPLGDGAVVAAAWGVLQRCDGVDAEALGRFIDYYADRELLDDPHGAG